MLNYYSHLLLIKLDRQGGGRGVRASACEAYTFDRLFQIQIDYHLESSVTHVGEGGRGGRELERGKEGLTGKSIFRQRIVLLQRCRRREGNRRSFVAFFVDNFSAVGSAIDKGRTNQRPIATRRNEVKQAVKWCSFARCPFLVLSHSPLLLILQSPLCDCCNCCA